MTRPTFLAAFLLCALAVASPLAAREGDPTERGSRERGPERGTTTYDFGDAPDPTYPTLLASDGARHVLGGGLMLGSTVDAETDGQPSSDAGGDDTDGADDEDGIFLAPSTIIAGGTIQGTIVASGTGLLDAWIDGNGDGDWNDPGEKIVSSQSLVAGSNPLSAGLPANAVPRQHTYMRFRFSSAGTPLPTGEAADGEVEDARVFVHELDISATAAATPSSIPEPGGTSSIEFSVENTGTATYILTSVTDSVLGQVAACSGFNYVNPGTTYTCTYDAAITGNAGDTLVRTVTAAGGGPLLPLSKSADVAVSVTDVLPTATVAVVADPGTVVAGAGETVQFTATITNTGPESLSLSALSSTLLGNLHGQGTCSADHAVASGASLQCQYSAEVDGAAGSTVTEEVTATLADDEGNGITPSGSDDVQILAASVGLAAVADPTSVPEPGATVSIELSVENTGGVEISVTGITDSVSGVVGGTCSFPQALAAAATYACSYDVSITGNAGETPSRDVTVNAAASGLALSDMSSVAVSVTDVLPTATVAVVADVETVVEGAGETVHFAVTVANTGPEELTLTVLSGTHLASLDGVGTCAVPQAVAIGGDYQCGYEAVVDGVSGETVTETVTATLEDDEANEISPTGEDAVTITETVPPQVLSVLDGRGDVVEDCGASAHPPSALIVTFDEAVENAGLSDSYEVFEAGPNGEPEVSGCGSRGIDDVLLGVDEVTLGGTPEEPTATLHLHRPPADGLVRLLVCPEITDTAGNALDGNGDGTGGDSGVVTFRVERENRFDRGHFDCQEGLDRWIETTTAPDDWVEDVDDAEAVSFSGSAGLVHTSTDPAALSQCVVVAPGQPHELRATVRLEDLGDTATLTLSCELSSAADCSTGDLGVDESTTTLTDTAGAWQVREHAFAAPLGAVSALCSAIVQPAGSGAFDIDLDRLFVGVDADLFADGFETGDVSRW